MAPRSKPEPEEVPLPQCLVCSSLNVHLWTLDSGRRAAMIYLCQDHASTMESLMDLAGNEPPSRQKPLREARRDVRPPEPDEPPVPRAPRRRTMRPLEWTPPPADGAGVYKH